MTCHKIIKLAYLKEVELDDKDRARIRKHVRKCSSCREQFANIHQNDVAIMQLQSEPTLHDPDLLTNEIMRQVRRTQKSTKLSLSISERVIEAMTRRQTRLAFGTAVILLLGLFCVQEATILRRLHHMEQRMSQQSTAVNTSSPLASLRRKAQLLQSSTDSKQVVIDKKSLEELVNSYSELQIENKILLKLLQEKTLSEAGISLEDGLTSDELKTLIDSDAILKKIYNL